MKSKRKFSSSFKAKVALEALKEHQTTAELAKKYDLHSTQISAWKKEFVAGASDIFEKGNKASSSPDVDTKKEEALYSKIGKLQIELDFLKKALS